MLNTYCLVVFFVGFYSIMAEELLTGTLVAEGDTKEEVFGLAFHTGIGVAKFTLEEVKVMDKNTTASSYLVELLVSQYKRALIYLY